MGLYKHLIDDLNIYDAPILFLRQFISDWRMEK